MLALQTFFEPSPANRRRCNLKTVTTQQIVTPLHLESNAQHHQKHFEICFGAHVLLEKRESYNGTSSPVATNRILSLLSPLVITSVSEVEAGGMESR